MLVVLSVHFFSSTNDAYISINLRVLIILSFKVYPFGIQAKSISYYVLVSCYYFSRLKYQNEIYTMIAMRILWSRPNCI